jgi:hypothetical protein
MNLWSSHFHEILENFVGMVMKSSIFWDTTCRPLKVNQYLGGTCRIHLQVCLPPSFTLISCLVYSSALKKHRLTFNGLYGFISQKIEHFRIFFCTFQFAFSFPLTYVHTGAHQRLDWGRRWLSQHQTIIRILLLYGFPSYSVWSTLRLYDAAHSTAEFI